MISLGYCTNENIPAPFFDKLLNSFPHSIKEKVSGFKNTTDKQLRILGSQMLLQVLKEDGCEVLLKNLKYNAFNKPEIGHWKNFNFSYSGKWVFFCYSKYSIGIDVELEAEEIEIQLYLPFFHPEEKVYILSSENISKSFYEIWVKKEAVLKAIGIGLWEGLHAFSCITDSVYFRGKTWYLKRLNIMDGYTCYLCTDQYETEIEITSFSPAASLYHRAF